MDNYKTICVNLKRRPDRREQMIKRFESANITNYEFFDAVDGTKLDPNDEAYNLFKHSNTGVFKPGAVGCALSHYNIWKNIVSDDKYNPYVIFEDDATLSQNFKSELEKFLSDMTHDTSIVHIGNHIHSNHPETKKWLNIYRHDTSYTIHPLNKTMYGGGTFGYIITKEGARKLLNYIWENGIQHEIDCLILKSNFNLYETRPHIVFSGAVNPTNNRVDSDIQYGKHILNFNKLNNTYSFDDYIFYPNKDSMGGDIREICADIPMLKNIADNTDHCVAFNSYGYIKHSIAHASKFISLNNKFYTPDGLYVKQKYSSKSIWVYWNTGYDNMPLIIKHIYNSNRKICEKYNYKFILLTNENLCNYIDNIHERFLAISPNYQSDYVRYNILEKYGGLWLDTNFIIFDNPGNLFNLIGNNEMLLTEEFSGKIGCAVILAKPRTITITHATKRIRDMLSGKIKLDRGDLGSNTAIELYKLFSNKILLIKNDVSSKSFNIVGRKLKPGYNIESWYKDSTEDAVSTADNIKTHNYPIIGTSTIYRKTSYSPEYISKMVMRDSKSIFNQLITQYNKLNLPGQMSNYDEYDRYPDVHKFIENMYHQKINRDSNITILVYGCSSGEEIKTLKTKYIPNSTIIGVDINNITLEAAKKRFSSDKTIRIMHPDELYFEDFKFDIILCNSVFCIWPPDAPTNIKSDNDFNFERFDNYLIELNRYLKPGGCFVIYNSKFLFTESSISSQYVPINTKHSILSSGFVKKYHKDYTPSTENYCIFKKKDPQIVYGLMQADTFNIGDDIQALAAKQFLPSVNVTVSREYLHNFKSKDKTRVILNGWFMHYSQHWPPSDMIDPVFISFHIYDPVLADPKYRDYYKKYEPIGCRDQHTVELLKNIGVDAYLSYCLTLTLNNKFNYRTDDVYLVDVERKHCSQMIPSNILDKAICIGHLFPDNYNITDFDDRLKKSEDLLKKYSTAKFVITSRLHCALPCLAFGTPVLFLFKDVDTDPRFTGYKDLMYCYSKPSIVTEFDWNNPKPKRDITPIKKQLIDTLCKYGFYYS